MGQAAKHTYGIAVYLHFPRRAHNCLRVVSTELHDDWPVLGPAKFPQVEVEVFLIVQKPLWKQHLRVC